MQIIILINLLILFFIHLVTNGNNRSCKSSLTPNQKRHLKTHSYALFL